MESKAAAVVRQYLEAWAERGLAAARRLLAEGFTMGYPGGASFTRLEDLAAHMAPRYRRVRKRFERCDDRARRPAHGPPGVERSAAPGRPVITLA